MSREPYEYEKSPINMNRDLQIHRNHFLLLIHAFKLGAPNMSREPYEYEKSPINMNRDLLSWRDSFE